MRFFIEPSSEKAKKGYINRFICLGKVLLDRKKSTCGKHTIFRVKNSIIINYNSKAIALIDLENKVIIIEKKNGVTSLCIKQAINAILNLLILENNWQYFSLSSLPREMVNLASWQTELPDFFTDEYKLDIGWIKISDILSNCIECRNCPNTNNLNFLNELPCKICCNNYNISEYDCANMLERR